MLMVASDRVSVFDVVLPDQIPDKGRVLTGLSHFWFERTRDIAREPRDLGRPHRLPGDGRRRGGPGDARARVAADPARVRGARLPVRRTAGRSTGARHRRRLLGARGLATGRATAGAVVHADDEGRVGSRRPGDARRSRRSSSETSVYEALRDALVAAVRRSAPRSRDDCGVILADTKFEFGELDDEILVIDEMMTPDSSRYWPAEDVRGRRFAAVVRQAVRARLHGRDRLGPRTARAAHVARGDREHPGARTARRTSSSPARVSTTGSDPTTPEPAARSCRRRSLWWGRARQPAAMADLPERTVRECRWRS